MAKVRVLDPVDKFHTIVEVSRAPCVGEELVVDAVAPAGAARVVSIVVRVSRVRHFPTKWRGINAAVVVARVPDNIDDFPRF